MQTTLISYLVGALIKVLSPEAVKSVIDKLLDAVEDAVSKSNTKIDDQVVLPLVNAIRVALNVPDNDK